MTRIRAVHTLGNPTSDCNMQARYHELTLRKECERDGQPRVQSEPFHSYRSRVRSPLSFVGKPPHSNLARPKLTADRHGGAPVTLWRALAYGRMALRDHAKMCCGTLRGGEYRIN